MDERVRICMTEIDRIVAVVDRVIADHRLTVEYAVRAAVRARKEGNGGER